MASHPSIEAARSGVSGADERIRQAESAHLPKVNYTESFQRSNNPVFVFSSLLSQRQFATGDFAIDTLNNPSALNNFQSQLTVEQPLYDAGVARHAIRGAELQKSLTEEDRRKAEQRVIGRVASTYLGLLLAADLHASALAAVRAAESDLERATAVREAGMSTDADVLSIRVHQAAMREQEIRRQADLAVARAALNEAIGLPLDTQLMLTTPLEDANAPPAPDSTGGLSRPELRQARLAVQLAETQTSTARAAYLPQVSVRAALEANRQRFVTRAGGNWFAGVTLRWNLFNGFADQAKIAEAGHSLTRARATERETTEGINLEVRRAQADVDASQQRIAVVAAAVAEAEESLRIIRDRYEAGLATVTDLLRSEAALVESRSRRAAAVHDRRLSVVALDFARGTLAADSDSLK
jgi:outer membrane protein TolC